jgi:ATP-binding cassette, subfamily B (MDR/TAP), member 1
VFQLLNSGGTEDFALNLSHEYVDVSLRAPDVKFENISHKYTNRPEIEVLKNVSFVAQSGKCCAIVGQSGSGKSSLVALLLRLYRPTAGSIHINNIAINSISLTTLRGRLCSVVSQEPVLFKGTIRDNVLYALSENQTRHLSESTISEMVNRALSIACVFDFVDSLPQKISTEIGDRGVTLSGGQKQRIAIARAVITNPPILLLDEAMSALDPESEVAVQKALNSAMKLRTTVMVSHRISSVIEMADHVVVMHKGLIVEQGAPRLLLENESNKANSLRMLYQSQQGISSG